MPQPLLVEFNAIVGWLSSGVRNPTTLPETGLRQAFGWRAKSLNFGVNLCGSAFPGRSLYCHVWPGVVMSDCDGPCKGIVHGNFDRIRCETRRGILSVTSSNSVTSGAAEIASPRPQCEVSRIHVRHRIRREDTRRLIHAAGKRVELWSTCFRHFLEAFFPMRW